ncbi:hypothetical protein AAG570_005686 [Ranatra chinensis]|uniref:Uncharacterized protein n=1 Tax=Ranatra chinensis TaxID=642074 RepID=A0ABD0XY96_9HEMI
MFYENKKQATTEIAKKGNIDRIQSFQSKVLRTVLNAPWLIDFQVVHRNTFAIDFSVLLYTSASEEVRSCRVDDLLAIYRETVVETLELCGRAADDVHPLAELRAALEKKRFYGVIVGLAACLVSRVEQGIPLDVTERVLPIQHLVRSPSVWEHVKDILRPHLGKKLLDLKPKKE